VIPVGGLVDVIPASTVTVRTWSGGSIDEYGSYSASGETDTTETMPVHPATSRRFREMLPEAVRDRETIALYPRAGSALSRASGVRSPEVQYGGRWYTVTADGDYETLGGIRLVLAILKDTTS